MLVITRKVGEDLVIGGAVRLRVVAITGGKVRLALDAPPGVRVDHAEVRERRTSPGAPEPTDRAEPRS